MREKRRIVFALLLCLALPAAALAQEAATATEKAVPADVLVFAQVKDFSALTSEFEQTLVAKTIGESEMLDAARDALVDILRFACAYSLDTTYAEIKEVVGKNIAIAVFDGTDGRALPPIAVVVDISATKEKFQKLLGEKIRPKLVAIAGEQALSQKTEDGKTVECLRLPNQKEIYFATVGDVFVFGNLDGVKKMMVADAPRLADDPTYKAVRAATDVPTGFTAYLNLVPIWAHFETEWQNNPADKAGLEALGLMGIRALAASAKFEGQGLHDKFFVYTGDQRVGLLDHFASQPPQPPKSAALVPRQYALYARLLTGGGLKLFDAFKEMLRATEGEQAAQGIEQMRTVVQQQAMLDVEQDIIATLGNEVFLAADLSALTTGQKPKFSDFTFVAGAEVSDPTKLEGSLAQLFSSPLFANQGVALDSFDHNGTTIHVLSFPQKPAIRPSYAFVGGFFVFSLRTEAIQAVVDTAKAGNGLAKSEDYAAVMGKLPAESNLSAYLDTGRLARGLVAALGPKAPPKAKPFVPVLAALAEKLTGMGIAARGVSNGIMAESCSPVGGPTFLLAAVSLGSLCKPSDVRALAETQKRLNKIEAALRVYKQRTGVYPASLSALTPKPFKRVPLDPFSKDGAPFQYLSTTTADAAPAPVAGQPAPAPVQPAKPSMFLLWSVGPDRKPDITAAEMTIEQWKAKGESNAPADVEFVKQKVYQFKKEQNADERDQFDEGDVVRVGM